MYIIEKKGKTVITLKEKELLEVQVMKGNPLRLQIKCKDGNMIISECISKHKKSMVGANKKDCD